MPRPVEFEWTDRAVTSLRLWWAQGLSTLQIAERFGPPCTKNAVIGKAHRLKLPSRASPIGKRSTELRKPRGGKRPTKPQEAKKVVLTLVPTPAPEPRVAAPVPAPEPSPTRFLARKASACCWPFGEPRTPDFRFCDAVALAGKPYCQEHYDIAYRPYRPKAEHLADQVAAGVEIANRRGPIRMRSALPR